MSTHAVQASDAPTAGSVTQRVLAAACGLMAAARRLGVARAPTEDQPYKLKVNGDPEDFPVRLYRLVEALEALDAFSDAEIADAFAGQARGGESGEAGQTGRGSGGMPGSLLALHSLLVWLMSQGMDPADLRQVADDATASVMGAPRSVARIAATSSNITRLMGAAAPAEITGIRVEKPGPVTPQAKRSSLQSRS